MCLVQLLLFADPFFFFFIFIMLTIYVYVLF